METMKNFDWTLRCSPSLAQKNEIYPGVTRKPAPDFKLGSRQAPTRHAKAETSQQVEEQSEDFK